MSIVRARSLAARLALAATSLVVLAGSGAAAAPPMTSVCLRPPVTAGVIDPFRVPACTWCPGHRGLEYGTRAGAAVHAAAPGRVSFAGPVAGVVWVTIAHPAGLVSTYGPLARVAVRRGQSVAAGQTVGVTQGALHFGVRRHGQYVDPAGLLGTPVHLVPRLIPPWLVVRPVAALRCPAGHTAGEPPASTTAAPVR
jgi:murein DD-endopeptidase MepM/ murein hydrolase activator NlpD